MISAEYYGVAFIFLVVLFSIAPIRKLSFTSYYFGNTIKDSYFGAVCLCIFVILFVGCRENSTVFADGPGYWEAMIDHRWEHYVNNHWFAFVGGEADNYFIFARLMAFMSFIGVSPRLCFIILDAIIYGFSFIALRKLFPNDILLAFLLYCGTFGTFGFSTNGIKNGCAFSMFLCAFAYKDNWKKCLLFLLLALGFHHSMQLSLAAFILCLFYKNTKTYLYVWIFALLMAILHVSFFQILFAGYTDEHAAGYLISTGGEYSYLTGFRLDFILYSAAPIALGLWVINKKKIVSPEYSFILNVYLVMNSIWLLCMYASFTNRIAQLSWSLFPILILYPLTKLKIAPNQNNILKWFVIGQLSFTFLMSILYIGRT